MILFSVVRKITASRENRGELLGDEVMKTASHRNCTLQVALIEFEQLLHDRKWEFVFTLQSHFVDFSRDPTFGEFDPRLGISATFGEKFGELRYPGNF